MPISYSFKLFFKFEMKQIRNGPQKFHFIRWPTKTFNIIDSDHIFDTLPNAIIEEQLVYNSSLASGCQIFFFLLENRESRSKGITQEFLKSSRSRDSRDEIY